MLFDECDDVDDVVLLSACDEAQQQLCHGGHGADNGRRPSPPPAGAKHDAPWHQDVPPGHRPYQGGGGPPPGGGGHARPPQKSNGPPPPQPLGNFNRGGGPGPGGGYGGHQGNPASQYHHQAPPQQRVAPPMELALRPGSLDQQQLQAQQRLPDVPSSAIFNKIQQTALECLTDSDYQVMGGKRFIKKSGWRRLAMFFGISLEIRSSNEVCDPNGNITRATFVVRGTMASGRFSDAYGSCDRGEKRFPAPNRDIPATAETRAASRAIQSLLGISE